MIKIINNNYLSKNLKLLRNCIDESQERFAERFNVKRSNIASYERGTEPRLLFILDVANYFQLKLDDLVSNDLELHPELLQTFKEHNNQQIPQVSEPLLKLKQRKDEQNQPDSKISERVSLIINRLSTSRNSFANDLGYPKPQTIYDITDGKSAPSYDFFRRFMLSEYSEVINIDWLLTGRGKMIIAPEPETSSAPTDPAIIRMIRKVVSENALLEKKVEEMKEKKGRG